MTENKFYVCEHCGNLVGMIHHAGVTPVCCGQKMTALSAKTEDAGQEKHLPVVTVEGDTVRVQIGSVAHPMTEEHSIQWVYLQTDRGGQRKALCVGETPEVMFALCDETPVAVYAYCNLHGLWVREIREEPVCPLQPVDTETHENYTVCKCNDVSYFDILDAVHRHNNIDDLLSRFEAVKNTTQCTTGCGGCYDKVLQIISESMDKREG